ncbi:hypothetical protein II898_11240, partial [bacterium]|nr:hypothetical protein [bacterium]
KKRAVPNVHTKSFHAFKILVVLNDSRKILKKSQKSLRQPVKFSDLRYFQTSCKTTEKNSGEVI